MKYNVASTVRGFTGEELKDGPAGDAKPASLRTLLQLALVNADPATYKTGEQKYKLYKLLTKIHENDILDVEAEEVATLKDVVGRLFGVSAVGAIYAVLENPINDDSTGSSK